jgi:hypothetical protein
MKNLVFWDVTVPRIMSSYALGMFVILWVGFVVALIVNQSWLDMLWNWVQILPLWLKIIVWLALLPIMTGLWIWQSSWSIFVQVLAAAGMIGWTWLAVSSFIKAFK